MAKTAAQALAKWKANSASAGSAYESGIQNTSVDVMGRAIQQKGAAVQNYAQALSSGRWEAAIAASGGTANWKAMSVAKSGNYSTGINAAEQKTAAAFNKLIPAIEQITSSLPPRQPGNVAANVNNRVLGLASALHARKGEFKG